jgi:hypothetical protein
MPRSRHVFDEFNRGMAWFQKLPEWTKRELADWDYESPSLRSILIERFNYRPSSEFLRGAAYAMELYSQMT